MISLDSQSNTIMQITIDDIGRDIVYTALNKEYISGTSYIWYGNTSIKIKQQHVGWFVVCDETYTEYVAIEPTIDAAIVSLVWYAHRFLCDSTEELTYLDTIISSPRYVTRAQATLAASYNWTHQSAIDGCNYLRILDDLYLVDGTELHFCEL